MNKGKTLMQWLALISAVLSVATSLVLAASAKRTDGGTPNWIFYWLYGFSEGCFFLFFIRIWMRRR